MKILASSLSLSLLILSSSPAAVVVNAPQTITHEVSVNVIQVARDDGSNPAPLFGTASEQAYIFSVVNQIWAQAGITVNFSFSPGTHNNTDSLMGTNSFSDVISQGAAAGFAVIGSGPLDLYMVRARSGDTPPLSNNSVAGRGYLDWDGMIMWAGPNLTLFENGRDSIAGVLAHEIGHNLGLSHPTTLTDGDGQSYNDNLMIGGSSPAALTENAEYLLQSQIDTVLTSPFVVAIPEPSSMILALLGLTGLCFHRRRK